MTPEIRALVKAARRVVGDASRDHRGSVYEISTDAVLSLRRAADVVSAAPPAPVADDGQPRDWPAFWTTLSDPDAAACLRAAIANYCTTRSPSSPSRRS